MTKTHSFHIPVMGIGFSIDTPLKVSHFGIDSVISLVDDQLIEKMRKYYSEKFEKPYKKISEFDYDFRAERISSYLNLMNDLAKEKFDDLVSRTTSKEKGLHKYLNMLPDNLEIKKKIKKFSKEHFDFSKAADWFKDNLKMGSIDVNIMTKVDKENYDKDEKLPTEFRDAHAAVRGFANSNLSSSLVLSAGMNPSLYKYLSKFDDFFPNKFGEIKKKIVLKVSDYRSALIQGKFLAKKGIWVSEFRIESGLNCGGHAFASDGKLLGPVLEEFKSKKEKLINSMYKNFTKALEKIDKILPERKMNIKITAQGGVGNNQEHELLLNHYEVDSVGWGTPFLLVPEAVSVDKETLKKLEAAEEKDLFLSDISPLGVRFNNLKGNTQDAERDKRIESKNPGAICLKKYAALSPEFEGKPLCTASSLYQHKKIEELNKKDLAPEAYERAFNKIVEKSCICVGLGTSTLISKNIEHKQEGNGVSICPGPNLAYFPTTMTLKQITNHIYGRENHLSDKKRPHMFVKEIDLYLDFLNEKIEAFKQGAEENKKKYFKKFTKNLESGIDYYNEMFENLKSNFVDKREVILNDLENSSNTLKNLKNKICEIFV